MWRNNTEICQDRNINFLLVHGALGDMIASLPAVCHARRTHTMALGLNLWVARYQVELVKHLIGGPGLRIKPLDEFKIKSNDPLDEGPGSINGLKPPIVTRNRFDMVDYAYATLLDMQPDNDTQRTYPHWAPLGPRPYDDPYIVLPVGATNQPNTFQPHLMKGLIEWCLEHNYKPVLTGKYSTDVVMMDKDKPKKLTITDKVYLLDPALKEKCLDLRDKTDLMQLRDWCGHAAAVVGIDGGTIHLAGTTTAPIGSTMYGSSYGRGPSGAQCG